MKKKKTQKKWIVSSKNLLVISQAQSSSEDTIAEFQAKRMNFIQKQQEVEHATPSEPTLHTENATIQRRISAKMRRGTLEAYKQAFLVPSKLNDRNAPPSGGVRWGHREMEEVINRRRGARDEFQKIYFPL